MLLGFSEVQCENPRGLAETTFQTLDFISLVPSGGSQGSQERQLCWSVCLEFGAFVTSAKARLWILRHKETCVFCECGGRRWVKCIFWSGEEEVHRWKLHGAPASLWRPPRPATTIHTGVLPKLQKLFVFLHIFGNASLCWSHV